MDFSITSNENIANGGVDNVKLAPGDSQDLFANLPVENKATAGSSHSSQSIEKFGKYKLFC